MAAGITLAAAAGFWTIAMPGAWVTHRHYAHLIGPSVVLTAGAVAALAPRTGFRGGLRRCLAQALGLVGVMVFMVMAPYGYQFRILRKTPLCARNIYHQQYQMGLFLRSFYRGQPVVAQDVGAISYLAEPQVVDVIGLATTEIALRRQARAGAMLPPAEIDQLARERHAQIAILHNLELVPDRWVCVASWTIPDNWVAGSDTVFFYAVDPRHEQVLRKRLRRFEPRLPGGIIVRYEDFRPGEFGAPDRP